jgi:hypothetical protein
MGYFVLGSVLIMRYNVFEGDGISRVANSAFVLTSRDPHLSAIGFVWNPLPSVIQIPLLAMSRWWPELETYGLAGVIQSAAFMAGAALIVRQIAFDRGVPRTWRWVAVAVFALNPMIILYGSLAMSEAAEVFCVLWCVRYLMKWADTQYVGDLAWAGIALGVGYLVRYEVLPAACGAAAVVAVVAFTSSRRQYRYSNVALMIAIVTFPIIVAVVSWALTGWIVNGELFATLTSQYGNSAQLAFAREHGGVSNNSDWLVIVQRMFAIQPFIGFAVIIAAAYSALTKRVAPLVPAATFGAVVVFAAWGQYTGTTFGWFRFYILAIPMVITIALALWTPPVQSDRPRRRTAATNLGAAVLSASMVVGIPVTAMGMLNEDITDRNQVMAGIASIIDPGRYPPDEWYRRMGRDDIQMAKYLDAKNLPDGSVLADTFVIKMLWIASEHPKQFVITSDYDFTTALNRPWDHGIKYIVVTNPATNGAPDAINKRWPSIWANGAGIATLVHTAAGPFGEERWRLYRVNPPPDELHPPG